MSEIDGHLSKLAEQQHGVFTRRQVRDAGLSPSAISKRVSRGDLIAVGSATLRLAGHVPSWRGLLTAGLLELGPTALVSGAAAAQLHELDGFDGDEVEFLVPRNLRGRKTVGRVRTTDEISRADRVIFDGLATTSPTRTVVEVLRNGESDPAGRALDSACRMRLTAHAVVRRRLDELGRPGRGGAALFDRLTRIGTVESWLERRFLALIARHGLPTPSLQQRYRLPDIGVARVDFEYSMWGLVIEVGGSRGYLSLDERKRQERRRNSLQLDGKTIYFFTRDDVVHDEAYVVRTIGAALNGADTERRTHSA